MYAPPLLGDNKVAKAVLMSYEEPVVGGGGFKEELASNCCTPSAVFSGVFALRFGVRPPFSD